MHVKTVTLATIDNPSWSLTPAISQWDKPSEAHTRFADNVKARTIDLAQVQVTIQGPTLLNPSWYNFICKAKAQFSWVL